MDENNNKSWLVIVVVVILLGIGVYLLWPALQNADISEDGPLINGEEETIVDEGETDEQEDDSEEMQNIVEIAATNPEFSTLVTALTEAGLVDTLSGEGPFTVFAPTNAAFAKIPEETLNEILADQEQLTAILTYHVVSGKVMAEDVVNLTSATTVQGGELDIEVIDGSVMVNDAQVIQTDIEAENGVIHVIDTVLIPQ